jgi:hypothetical protein
MNHPVVSARTLPRWPWQILLALLLVAPAWGRLLDDFNAAARSGWQDFTFIAGLGLPVQANGQYTFNLPPAGQSLFVASTKTTESFTLQDGRTIEFRADASVNGPYAYAVVAWIPGTPDNAQSLAGYGFAMSASDLIITKGINKYFVDDVPNPPIKSTNVTLVLSMAAANGSVTLHARVLDKDNNNAVLYDKTVVDTAAADPMNSGTDSPAAPYLGSGYYTLYCYENFHAGAQDSYQAVFDNAIVYVTDTTILDDFNAATRSGWQDFTFVAGLGLPVQANGDYTFDLPPANQSLFVASTKITRSFDLTEGNRLELRADALNVNGGYAYAVLAWIPGTPANAQSLAGYAFAMSTTDLLITKGINKYFVDDTPSPPVKNTNVTMVLTLTVANGSVTLEARVLDKDNNNAVLYDKTVVDTSAADPMNSGSDSPAAPYLGSGYYTLYCYENWSAGSPQDLYEAIFDNAIVAAPPVAGNTPAVISQVQPAVGANFLPAASGVSFQVTDDKALIATNIAIVLNGTAYTTANGLVLTGTGTNLTASFAGLVANVNYVGSVQVVDSDGATTTSPLLFDTFLASDVVIEVEDYNFNGGQFINNPVPLAEGTGPTGTSYDNQTGIEAVDYADTRTDFSNTPYRPNDTIKMQHSLDNIRAKFTAAGGTAADVFDYDVDSILAGQWLNYTRSFPAGSYTACLREALENMQNAEVDLQLVTSDATAPGQSTQNLGAFLGTLTGFQYRNFPLTDAFGNPVVLKLSGTQTLRLAQATADVSDGGAYQNYFILVPATSAGVQMPVVTSLSPPAGAVVSAVAPVINLTIQNRDTTLVSGSIVLTLNGTVVMPSITNLTSGATVSYVLAPLPASGATNHARLVFSDSGGSFQTNDWSFVITYLGLDPANRQAGSGQTRGMQVRLVEADQGTALDNSLDVANQQLATPPGIPAILSANITDQMLNYTHLPLPAASAYFPYTASFPGIDPNLQPGPNYFAIEALTYLDLPAGPQTFGVYSDDGFELTSGSSFTDASPLILGAKSGGTYDGTFDFVVPTAGLYPFRLVYYQTAGDSYLQWYSVDRASGTRTLINDPTAANAIHAYATLTLHTLELQSVAKLGDTWTTETGAIVNTTTKTIALPIPSGNRFYRISAATAYTFSNIQISGVILVLTYQ